MYTETERDLIRKAIEIIKSYEGEDINTSLCSERIIANLENLLDNTEATKNASNSIAIQGAANLISEYMENIIDMSVEEKTLSIEVIEGLNTLCNYCQSNDGANVEEEDNINKWRCLIERENKITSIKAYRVLEMLIDVLGKDSTLENAFNFVSNVREENKKDKNKDWKNIRDYVIKDLIEKITLEYAELISYSLEGKINWILEKILENLEFNDGDDDLISVMRENNPSSKVFSLLSEEKYIGYIIKYLNEIKQEIHEGEFIEESFGKNAISNDLSKLKYSWLCHSLVESRETEVYKGSFIEMLSEVYEIELEDVMSYSLSQLYRYAKYPYQKEDDYSLYLNIKPLVKVPIERKFALLLWKYILDMDNLSDLEIN